jgi:hypothetical protein
MMVPTQEKTVLGMETTAIVVTADTAAMVEMVEMAGSDRPSGFK